MTCRYRHHRPRKVQEENLYERRRRPDEFPDPVNDEIESFDGCGFKQQPDETCCQCNQEAHNRQAERNVDACKDDWKCVEKCFPAPVAHQLATPLLAIFSPFLDSQMRGSAMMKYMMRTIRYASGPSERLVER